MLSAAGLLAAAFRGLSAAWTAGLLFAALAAVTALHLLRTRPVPRRVSSILFWSAAMSAARPRLLWGRLRQALSWLVFAAFAASVVLAVSEWAARASPTEGRSVVVVLDAGLSMHAPLAGGGTRLDAGRQAARRVLRRCEGTDEVALVVADPVARAVHRFDQPAAAAARRLDVIEAADGPADCAAALRLAATLAAGNSGAQIHWITDAADAQRLAGEFAPDADVEVVHVGAGQENGAVLSAVFVPEATQPRVGRVLVEAGWWGRGPARLRVTARVAEGVVLDAARELVHDQTAWFESEPLEADGGIVEIVLAEPAGIDWDNRAALQLPDYRDMSVVVDDDVPAALRIAVAAVPGARRVLPETDAPVAVVARRVGERLPERSSLAVWRDGGGVPPGAEIDVAGEDALTAGLQFDGARAGSGARLNALLEGRAHEVLLTAGDAVLAAVVRIGDGTQHIVVSDALFAADGTALNHPALAILVARAIRELAGWTQPAYCLPTWRRVQDPVWTERQASRRPVTLVAGDRRHSDLGQDEPAAAAVPPAKRWLHLPTALLLGALTLLLVEAALRSRDRIP